MHVVKSVGVMSVAKIMGLVYGCFGLIFIPFFIVAGLAGAFAGDKNAFPLAGIFGIVLAVFMPLLYGGLGFVFGAIGALIYNLIAKWVGGFELELTVQPPAYMPPPAIASPPPSV